MAFIHMTRPNLDNVADVILPEGYTIRTYKDGEEDIWIDIINRSFGELWGYKQFHSEILDVGRCYVGDNLFFVEYKNIPIGTVCAWIIDNKIGYLHMMGVVPEYHHKGLGYILGLTALHYFRECGFDKITLATYPDRLSAVKTYLNLGFVPMYQEKDQAAWSKIFTDLKKRMYT